MLRTWHDIAHTCSQFIKKPSEVGALIPSSRFLAARMMNAVDLANAKTIVELGAGTGAITSELLQRARKDATILIIDNNPESISLLQSRLPENRNVNLIQADARLIKEIIAEFSIGKVDSVVSSLPYTSLGIALTREILKCTSEVLDDRGHFVAFQYSPVLRKTLEDYFNIERSEVEFRNFPPAIVYRCSSKGPADGQFNYKDSA